MANNTTYVTITLKDIEHKTEIDRIGLQIRKDSTTFSDNATGSIPQIDAIIKTTDGKIYKATQNLNSTYTDYDGNKTTTTNAAEPMGASMCEKFVKEYEWDAVNEKDGSWMNNAYFSIAYGNGVYVSNYYNKLYYSKNGKSWNLIKEFTSEIQSICYGNSKFIVVPYDTSDPYGYSTDGINWTFSDNTYDNIHPACCKIVYGNNKFVGLVPNDFSLLIVNSTDGINWTTYGNVPLTKNRMDYSSGGITNPAPNAFDIVYGNNKFVAVGCIEDIDNDYIPQKGPNLFYSTDGINWTATTISDSIVCWNHIYYINNKFYASGYHADQKTCNSFVIFAYSTNGINWTEYIPKWNDGTEMDPNEYSGFGDHSSSASAQAIFCKYDDLSMLGAFYNINYLIKGTKIAHIICKSSDGITWEKLYSISLLPESSDLGSDDVYTKFLCPKAIYYSSKDGIILVGDGSFCIMDYTKMIIYNWTVNEKSGEEFAYNELMPDTISTKSYNYTVSTKYDANSIDKHSTGAYRFSGWSQTGNITFTKDSPRVTEITGTWNWVDMVKYSYSWNAPSYSDLTGLVTLPTGGNAYAGDTVSVDTKYNSDSKVEVLNWNYANISAYRWGNICYGNGKFIVIQTHTSDNSDNTYNNYAYSTDGINWIESTLPVSKKWKYIYYLNNKFIITGLGTGAILYSTDGINWIESVVRFSENSEVYLCYGNGKYISVLDNNWSSKYAYSTDLVNWQEGQFPSSRLTYGNMCYAIQYGNNKFIVSVIESGTNTGRIMFYVSSDGINWNSIKPDWLSKYQSHNAPIPNLYYLGNRFIIFTNSNVSSEFYCSEDFENWTVCSYGWDTDYDIKGIAYGSGLYLINVGSAGSTREIWYSFDGIEWVKSKAPSKCSYSRPICYGNQKFIISSDDYDCSSNNIAYLTIPTSYYQFSGWNPSTDFIINENNTISGTWSKKNKLKVSYSWSNQPSGMKSKVPSDEYYHSGDNVMIDTTYNNKSGYKEEMKITENSIDNLNYVAWVTYGNSIYIASQAAYTKDYYRSTDGINWTKYTNASGLQYITFGNDKFVSLGHIGSSKLPQYSSDGINWTNITLPDTNAYWSDIFYGNGKFIGVPTNRNYNIIYSTDGINWASVSVSSNSNAIYYGCGAYCNGVYIIPTQKTNNGSTLTNIYLYSTDGISWSYKTMPSNHFWYSAAASNNLFVMTSGHASIADTAFAYSSDGINWTEITMPSNKYPHIAYGNGYFIVTVYNSNIFYYSSDGINWTEGTLTNSKEWSPVCYGNGEFLMIASTGTCALINLNPTYYQFSGWNKSDFNITADTAVSGSWSQVSAGGGVNFSELNTTSFGSRYAYGCIYAFDKYIVVGGDYRESTNFISYSNDCKSFTAIKPLSGSGSTFFSDLTFGNNILIATKRNGEYNYIARTTDGVNWTIVTISNTSRNWYSAVYGANKFVLFSNGYIAYSTDAINWTEKANAITINGNGCGPGYHSVIYDGQKFWARVNYQLKYCYSYSTDGINWTTTQVSQPWGNGSPSIYYCNGYSICYTSGNKGFKLYVSNDNITFTEHYSRADASNGWVYSNIIDYNGMYMFTLSTNSTGKIYLVYSTDLYNWNEFLIVEDTSILPICKAVYCDPNGKVFTVTSNHSNLYSFNISRLILII